MLFIFCLSCSFCDRFVIAGAPWDMGPLQQDGACQGSPVTGEPVQHLIFYELCVLFMFWTCLILVFVFKMCAAFALGKLQFLHVLGRCVGHMLFICFVVDPFLRHVCGALCNRMGFARGHLSQGNLCNIRFL